jgi:flagellar biosynthesis protein FlhF
VGPTGVGKSAAIAKLASRLSRARRAVAIATLDRRQAGAGTPAPEARALCVPFETARDGGELRELARGWRERDLVLLDTPGCSPRDRGELARLSESLGEARRAIPLDAYLVLSAGTARAACRAILDGFSELRPAASVLTKVDESPEVAAALECLGEAGLPVAFVCDGQDLDLHLHRARSDLFADLLLRGRAA